MRKNNYLNLFFTRNDKACFCSPEHSVSWAVCVTKQNQPSFAGVSFLLQECEGIPQLFTQWSLLDYLAAWQGFFFSLFGIMKLQIKWSVWALPEYRWHGDKNLTYVNFPQQMLNMHPCDPNT